MLGVSKLPTFLTKHSLIYKCISHFHLFKINISIILLSSFSYILIIVHTHFTLILIFIKFVNQSEIITSTRVYMDHNIV